MLPTLKAGGRHLPARVLLAAGLAALFLGGCGSTPEVLVPVKGKLIKQPSGSPLGQVVVTFHPQEEVNKGKLPSAFVGNDGTFSLTCLRGRYKVTLAVPATGAGNADPGSGPPGAPPPPSQSPSPIPPDYRTPERTPLEVVIPETGKADLVLAVG